MKLKLLLFLNCVALITAVPEVNSKRCFESSFCRRTRSKTNNFEVQMSTISSNSYGLTAEIKNLETDVILVLKLDCLENNSFHFEIDEKSPFKKRFRLTNQAIVDDIKKKPAQVSNTTNSATVTCDLNKAIIEFSPFKIEFYHNNVLSLIVNNRKLMTFEHLRNKTVPTTDDDEWEETFEGYTDSKPNGPEAIALDFTIDNSEILFGIPEHHDTFSLRRTLYGEPYRLFTTDMTFFELDSRMANYGAIPVIYGHTADGRTTGIFWHNAADTYVDIYDTKTSHFMSESGIIDVYIFLGPSPSETFKQYTQITGVGNLPQLFTLAYHQCRWSYMTQNEVLEIVKSFDQYEIPLDTMWLDIDYTDGKRYFTWNHTAFPKPLEMIAELDSTGRHLVFIIDPHVKVDDEYFFYDGLKDLNYFVKLADTKTDFTGNCWPGNSSYVDFLNPEARKFYADQYLITNFNESVVKGGIWNDMNEPAVFDAPEKTFPRDAMHYDGENFWEHRNLHNMYGLLHTTGTFDGLMRRGSGDYRPFILTRSFFAGSQKYTAVWTGDNTADWGYLHGSIQACLAISVAGISFCGSDIGGFFGNPDEELFYRWTQAAAFQPFFRNHASAGTEYREPYRFSNETRIIATNAIKLRYSFLPFWYTLFYEHEITGLPVMRPMLANYPLDKNVFKLDTQYMLSDKLLVAPVLEPLSSWVIVRFPSIDGKDKGEIWYDIDNYTKYTHVGTQAIKVDENKIAVFQRGGTIISRKATVKKSSIYMRGDPISIYIAVDKDGKAQGNVYFDDETSFGYRNGEFKLINFNFENKTLTVTENNFKSDKIHSSNIERVYIAGIKELKTAKQSCKDNNKRDFSVVEIHEEFFYIDVSGNEEKCENSWTLTLNGSNKNFISIGLLMSVLTFVLFRIFFE
ncbi:hypothetical protein PVAND_001426 [Polypedilum vanderplanki]|uniref:Glucosidase II subunit alpha n=1 Tax=Polypedilum vanderplanki TaxID=319348 RepID=A0A9J6BMX4_POLVA|nr:hypothetical protein PVAND_001426 [Polypedilum vanderplanki]